MLNKVQAQEVLNELRKCEPGESMALANITNSMSIGLIWWDNGVDKSFRVYISLEYDPSEVGYDDGWLIEKKGYKVTEKEALEFIQQLDWCLV